MKLHVNSRIENNTIKIYRFGDDMPLFSNANEKRLFLIKIEKKAVITNNICTVAQGRTIPFVMCSTLY